MLKTIKLATKQCSIPEYVVPNKVNYIWFSEKEHILKFGEYLSILSVHKIQKPDGIYFYTNYAPSGHYWNKLLQFPEFYTIHRERPRLYLVLKLKKEASDSDITMVKILMQEGEIYLDADVWVLKSWDLLIKFKFVLGFRRFLLRRGAEYSRENTNILKSTRYKTSYSKMAAYHMCERTQNVYEKLKHN